LTPGIKPRRARGREGKKAIRFAEPKEKRAKTERGAKRKCPNRKGQRSICKLGKKGEEKQSESRPEEAATRKY